MKESEKQRQKSRSSQHQTKASSVPRRFAVPSDTAQIVAANWQKCLNLSLLLDHFAPWEHSNGSWKLIMREQERSRSVPRTGEGAKAIWLRDKLKGNEIDPPLQPSSRIDADLLRVYKERWETIVATVNASPFEKTVDWRLIVGLGAAHVLETSITLHRIYGFPFIPGSGLKGMTRAYAKVLGKSEKDKDFGRIFGSQEQAGEIIFFDAIPSQVPRLKLDVMNPHYSKYYQGSDTPPADWLSPVPVYFLTVEHTPFLFAIAARRKEAKGLLPIAEQWLKDALSELGAGAKTTAGYGYFISPEAEPSE